MNFCRNKGSLILYMGLSLLISFGGLCVSGYSRNTLEILSEMSCFSNKVIYTNEAPLGGPIQPQARAGHCRVQVLINAKFNHTLGREMLVR